MRSPSNAPITALLRAWGKGEKLAEQNLWPLVFAELKRMARRQMAQERPDHTLQSGALVNEAYLRLVDWKDMSWENRAHFFGMCARMMRQILVDHARTRNRQKRGGVRDKISLEDTVLVSEAKGPQLLALDEAMKRLATIHPRKSKVVEMRFFGGLSFEETAEVLQVSRLTVIRDWNFARAWLLAEMSGEKIGEE